MTDQIQAAKERLTNVLAVLSCGGFMRFDGADVRVVLAELSRLEGEERQSYKQASLKAVELDQARRENERLRGLLNSPETEDFMRGVPLEAAHQVERWGADHDAGKEPLDWFWLIGFLAQKAATSAMAGDLDKAKHHTISTAAALANWHAQLSGKPTAMRPGVDADERGFAALLASSEPSAPATAAIAPEPPWPATSLNANNAKREGWKACFEGRERDKCPFPSGRSDLQRGYREGWDAALRELDKLADGREVNP